MLNSSFNRAENLKSLLSLAPGRTLSFVRYVEANIFRFLTGT